MKYTLYIGHIQMGTDYSTRAEAEAAIPAMIAELKDMDHTTDTDYDACLTSIQATRDEAWSDLEEKIISALYDTLSEDTEVLCVSREVSNSGEHIGWRVRFGGAPEDAAHLSMAYKLRPLKPGESICDRAREVTEHIYERYDAKYDVVAD